MGKKVIYIAGAQTTTQYRMDAEAAEREVTARGFVALNPARLPEDLSDRKFGQICTAMIDSADAVLLLPNWPADKSSAFAKAYSSYTEKLYSTNLDTLIYALFERYGG